MDRQDSAFQSYPKQLARLLYFAFLDYKKLKKDQFDSSYKKILDNLDTPLFTMQFRIDSAESKSETEIELNFFSTYTSFGTPHDIALQELRIECFYPADKYTREYCQHLSAYA